MIEMTLNNVNYGFFDLDEEGGKIVAFQDTESGIVIKVPFNKDSWKVFAAGVDGREIAVPTLEEIRNLAKG